MESSTEAPVPLVRKKRLSIRERDELADALAEWRKRLARRLKFDPYGREYFALIDRHEELAR